MSLLNAIISILCLVGLALAIMHRRRPSAGKRKEITTLERVKRRRRLTKRLNRIVGDELEAMQLLREEARDLHLPVSNLETLEAAIKRARLERKPSAPTARKKRRPCQHIPANENDDPSPQGGENPIDCR